MTLIDSFGRIIDYLRVSVTDRCNFRCVYCMPETGAPVSPKSEILSFEELERLIRIAVSLGITKVRLTGGEPLVRRNLLELVKRIGSLPGLIDLSMTTNGFLLAPQAQEFVKAGLNRVNISLDTLNHERFNRIARRGNLADTLAGIEAAATSGMSPVKLNCVVMRGWNEDEVIDFARLTQDRSFHVRFIELMPINWSKGDDSVSDGMAGFFALSAKSGHRSDASVTLYARSEAPSFGTTYKMREGDPSGQLDALQMRRAFVASSEIRAQIETEFGPLIPAHIVTNGPARTYRISGAAGTLGFISQITSDQCLECNRLRLTADGQLRPCLMADGEVDLRTPLRTAATDSDLAELFRLTVFHKPKEHRLEDGMAPVSRNMSQLGG